MILTPRGRRVVDALGLALNVLLWAAVIGTATLVGAHVPARNGFALAVLALVVLFVVTAWAIDRAPTGREAPSRLDVWDRIGGAR